MACDIKSTGIILESCSVSWGRRQTTCVTPIAAALADTYFTISNTVDSYYVWYDITGAGIDPTPAGFTGIEVDVSGDNTTSGIITATKTAMELLSFWVTPSSDGLSMKIESKIIGAFVTGGANAADVDTTFTISTEAVGLGGDLGKTDGGIELAMETTVIDIKADQTGEILLDRIASGFTANVAMDLLEMTAAKWSLLVGDGVGGNYTPGAGTEVTGYGSAGINRSFFDVSGEMVLHPVSRASSDNSRDITFHISTPMPESINFSSTEVQKMSITFDALLDDTKNANVDLFAFGDSTQDLRI